MKNFNIDKEMQYYYDNVQRTINKDYEVVKQYFEKAKCLVDELLPHIYEDKEAHSRFLTEVYYALRKQETVRTQLETYILYSKGLLDSTKLGSPPTNTPPISFNN